MKKYPLMDVLERSGPYVILWAALTQSNRACISSSMALKVRPRQVWISFSFVSAPNYVEEGAGLSPPLSATNLAAQTQPQTYP